MTLMSPTYGPIAYYILINLFFPCKHRSLASLWTEPKFFIHDYKNLLTWTIYMYLQT